MIILQKDLKHQCLLDVLFHFRINDRNLFTLIIDNGFTGCISNHLIIMRIKG